MELCGKIIPTRANSKYDPHDLHRCFREAGHSGRCDEFPYLDHLKQHAPNVAKKIVRDATKTTGASWKSSDAGPNRISRWTMLLGDEELLALGIDMSTLKPWVVAKLREKSATYDECMSAALSLTWSAYSMINAPDPDSCTSIYLKERFKEIEKGSTVCLICRDTLDFSLFKEARRGKAEIETAHAQPRVHNAENIGFAHRCCNIAQGDKTLAEFYSWIQSILVRANRL